MTLSYDTRAVHGARLAPHAATQIFVPARQYPHVLCAVDTGMVKGMLEGLYGETSPMIEQSRPHGDDTCVTRV